VYLEFDKDIEVAYKLFDDFYKEAPFTHISKTPIHLKQVVNTNNCFLHLEKYKNTLLITSVIDNLLKGASGQVIQNMNLMFGFNETDGLQLKASSF
jgi:N-acetyl-gamma-glutamyl-phosphate reductase